MSLTHEEQIDLIAQTVEQIVFSIIRQSKEVSDILRQLHPKICDGELTTEHMNQFREKMLSLAGERLEELAQLELRRLN